MSDAGPKYTDYRDNPNDPRNWHSGEYKPDRSEDKGPPKAHSRYHQAPSGDGSTAPEGTNPWGPTPGDASVPALGMAWGPPPSFTGAGPDGTGTGDGPEPPPHSAVVVDLSTVRGAEEGLLRDVTDVVNQYNPLRVRTAEVIAGNTLFGQNAHTTDMVASGWGPGAQHTKENTLWKEAWVADKTVQEAARQFAEVIGPTMQRALRQTADVTVLVGQFIAMLDKAGQAYTKADQHSFFPALQNPGKDPGAPPPGAGGNPSAG